MGVYDFALMDYIERKKKEMGTPDSWQSPLPAPRVRSGGVVAPSAPGPVRVSAPSGPAYKEPPAFYSDGPTGVTPPASADAMDITPPMQIAKLERPPAISQPKPSNITPPVLPITNEDVIDRLLAKKAGMLPPMAQPKVDPTWGFVMKEEGFRSKAYDDGGGRTVGYGFYMDNADSREVFDKLGVPNFDAVYKGTAGITEEQAKALMDYRIQEANRFLDEKLGDTSLSANQRTALVSLYYNGGPKLVGPRLLEAVRQGNWEKAAEEVRLRSNRAKDKGLQRRREREASLLLSSSQ